MAYSARFKAKFFDALDKGASLTGACKTLGIARETGYNWLKEAEATGGTYGAMWRDARLQNRMPEPLLPHQLSPEARLALDDFEYFRYRYFGRRSVPWQVEAAANVIEWLESPNTEYVVVNCPPGSGKTTLFTCDIPTWVIVKDRTKRIFLGHRSASKAGEYTQRIRRVLERTMPLPAGKDRPEAAQGCLSMDYGRFKPPTGETWTKGAFTVLTSYGDDEQLIEDKEPSVTSNGMETEFLGSRAELAIWDDLVTSGILRNMESVEAQRKWWDDEGVTRVEPGGALLLVGQRMGPEDLYRYCLEERLAEEDEETGEILPDAPSRYRKVIYPAHFEDRCHGDHDRKTAKPYPEGCLLDPVRYPWTGPSGLATIRLNREEKYRVLYQQEDGDPQNVLVPKLWIDGGRDPETGIQYPGCLDTQRGIAELPNGLAPPWYSIASADPSPTKMWGILWWVYHPATEQRFLMDVVNQAMDAPDFLDWNENGKVFYGLMQDWQERSVRLNAPITTWIVERNAAQRFMLQYEFMKRWQREWQVDILPHDTNVNKVSDEYGIQMLRDRYRFGNVRIPYKAGNSFETSTALTVKPLIEEVTRYSGKGASRDDCLMAQWFFEYNLANLTRPRQTHIPRLSRPSWMRQPALAGMRH